ncbi:tRNA pseudouridine(38-40) synthase TruA [Thioflexithrix psekupsensis]|uniref:tRNA pseudouridine synthase A n=1 Tax=Thioflexithrix psekupsensis TaxID=1570016 RepID=A0A251X747_9GAMM|nr:tRNA pseudouridine(38-40) synthase TruA [Thioflexithrix psekupsensis]OUD13214.1 tRNA pseudouridine(38-40) synthase TruA [Thioflexithrix psekupsensis]
MRIALGVEYNGSPYCGWQYQDDADSVQAQVEAALSRVADHKVTAICAGRTDRGVHAVSQIIHIDVHVERSMRAWVLGGNVNLPRDIGILWAQPVSEQFHARFSARARHYRYLILNRMVRPGLLHHRVTWEHHPLEVELMQTGANYLLGTHDFTSYRAVGCQAKNPIRTVHYLTIRRQQELIVVEIGANGFLHHMVRNIVGVLLKIGRQECPPEWANTVLLAKNRTAGGMTAPAHGLYFYGVDYDAPFHFPRPPVILPVL